MGSPNANSRIIERLNAIALLRSQDGKTASWVSKLRNDIRKFCIDGVWHDKELATYLAFRDFKDVFPEVEGDAAVIQTDQDRSHWDDEVPDEIKEDSGRILRQMILGGYHVTYAVQRDDSGGAWEVKETLTSTFNEEPPRYSVTWVVPTEQEGTID